MQKYANFVGGANNMHPLSWGGGGTKGKYPKLNWSLPGLFVTDLYTEQDSFGFFRSSFDFNKFSDLFCSPPSVFYAPPVTNYMLLYSTFLCKKIARAPGGRKKYKPTKLGGGGEQNRYKFSMPCQTPNYLSNCVRKSTESLIIF